MNLKAIEEAVSPSAAYATPVNPDSETTMVASNKIESGFIFIF